MATTRPGWSRRAQYGLFFSFIAVIAGIVVGLILLTLSLVAPQQFDRVIRRDSAGRMICARFVH